MFVSRLAFVLLFCAASDLLAQLPFRPNQAILQTALSDLVVTGEVIELEKEQTEVNIQGTKVYFDVAVVKISETLCGPGGLTRVRVGFYDSGEAHAFVSARGNDARYCLVPIEGKLLTPNQKGCFFLTMNSKSGIYNMVHHSFLDIKQTDYADHLKDVRATIKYLENPEASLQSKDRDTRLQAATALLFHYRGRYEPALPVEKEIPLTESKLLLEVVKEMPCMKGEEIADTFRPHRMMIWPFLETEKMGFKFSEYPPVPEVAYDKEMLQFLKDHEGKIHIKKRVAK